MMIQRVRTKTPDIRGWSSSSALSQTQVQLPVTASADWEALATNKPIEPTNWIMIASRWLLSLINYILFDVSISYDILMYFVRFHLLYLIRFHFLLYFVLSW